MYQRILLCYNGTLEGRRVLREGAQLALRFGAETHLLAVSRKDPETLALDVPLQEPLGPLTDALEEILKEGVARLKEAGLTAVGHLAFGEPVAEIVACARTLKADLVVVGHRHRGTLARWWSTSVDVSLVDMTPCSILIAINEEPHG